MVSPKVSHASSNRSEIKKHLQVINEFCETLKRRASKMISSGKVSTMIAPNLEALLDQRKALVTAVGKGMLERKDQEELIGLIAAFIWFNRLEEQRQHEILKTWGA